MRPNERYHLISDSNQIIEVLSVEYDSFAGLTMVYFIYDLSMVTGAMDHQTFRKFYARVKT